MRQLLLLRHAQSDPHQAGMTDHARTLSRHGRQEALTVRRVMHDLALEPQLVLVSSAHRTVQTAQALAPWARPPLIDIQPSLYLACLTQLLTILRDVDSAIERVMLIGHNPGLHELAMLLMKNAPPVERDRLVAGLPTGGLVQFTLSGSWADIAISGAGSRGAELVQVIFPEIAGSGAAP